MWSVRPREGSILRGEKGRGRGLVMSFDEVKLTKSKKAKGAGSLALVFYRSRAIPNIFDVLTLHGRAPKVRVALLPDRCDTVAVPYPLACSKKCESGKHLFVSWGRPPPGDGWTGSSFPWCLAPRESLVGPPFALQPEQMKGR